MKKSLYIYIILFTVITIFNGCQNGEEHIVDISSGISTSSDIFATASKNEDGLISLDKSDMEKLPEEEFDDPVIQKWNDKYENYKDDEGNEFTFKKGTDICVGFISKPLDADTDNIKSEDELKKIAEDFLREKVSISEYSLGYQYINDSGQICTMTFNKYIQGYKTSDTIGITVELDGQVFAYHVTDYKLFDNLDIPVIDKQMVDDTIQSAVKEKYGDADYKVQSETLIYEDKKFYIDYVAFAIEYADGNDEIHYEVSGQIPIK